MMTHKKKVGATVYQNNIIINLARIILLLCVLTIFFAMLWSGGNSSPVEYFLWLSLDVVFVYGVYIAGKSDTERNSKKENIIFIYGFLILSLTVFLDLMAVIKTNSIIVIIMAIPLAIVYKSKRFGG